MIHLSTDLLERQFGRRGGALAEGDEMSRFFVAGIDQP